MTPGTVETIATDIKSHDEDSAEKTAQKEPRVSRWARLNDGRWEQQLVEAQEFVRKLQSLREARSGDLALLRRNAGETLSSSRNVLSVFYKLQPPRGAHIEKYFLFATLFDLNRKGHIPGDFGESMRRVSVDASSSFQRRFVVLLDARFDGNSDSLDGYQSAGGELAYRLRQMVKLADSKDVGINWPVLLADLCCWDHLNKPVQKKWARNFYDFQPPAEDTSEAPADSQP